MNYKPIVYYSSSGGGAGGGGKGGGSAGRTGGGGLSSASNPAGFSAKEIQSVGNNPSNDEYVLQIGKERIIYQTEKAIGVATRAKQYAKYQAGQSPTLEWIPKSQIEGWYKGGGGNKGGLVLNHRWAVNNQMLRGLKYYPMKPRNLK